jgi:hypothetical protein
MTLQPNLLALISNMEATARLSRPYHQSRLIGAINLLRLCAFDNFQRDSRHVLRFPKKKKLFCSPRKMTLTMMIDPTKHLAKNEPKSER